MTTPLTSARRHINYHHSKASNFLLFLVILLLSPKKVFASSSFAPTCAAEQSLAYVNKGGNHKPKPLMRAWMCHGKTHKEMVDKLALVSM